MKSWGLKQSLVSIELRRKDGERLIKSFSCPLPVLPPHGPPRQGVKTVPGSSATLHSPLDNEDRRDLSGAFKYYINIHLLRWLRSDWQCHVLARIWRNKSWYTRDGNEKWYSHFAKQFFIFLFYMYFPLCVYMCVTLHTAWWDLKKLWVAGMGFADHCELT